MHCLVVPSFFDFVPSPDCFILWRPLIRFSMTMSSPKPIAERYFYSAAVLLLLILVAVGFQLFYFHGQMYPGRPLTPPIKTLIITHGVAMLLWMLLSLTQPFLIANGKRRMHMALGKVAAVVALCLVFLGLELGIAACKVAPPGLMYGPLTPKQFMAIPVLNIALFAVFVAAGVGWRKRPEIHKPMMFMATLTAVTAAIARIDFFNHLYAGTIWQKIFGNLFFALVVGAVFVIAKCIVFRKFDRWLVAGYVLMVVWFLMIAQGAPTPAWDSIASLLLR